MYIGEVIKRLRKEKKISLVELSQMTGVQVATISRIENKKMVGTLESHMNIAKALGVDVTDLYREMDLVGNLPPIPAEPVEIFKHQDESSVELLTKDVLRKKMMPVLIHLKSKAKSPTEQYRPGTERFAYALKGSFDLTIDEKTYHIKEGTSMYIDASHPHQFINTIKEAITILCVTTPAAL